MSLDFVTPVGVSLSAYVNHPNDRLRRPRFEARLSFDVAEAAPLMELADFVWHNRDKRRSRQGSIQDPCINSTTLPDGRIALTFTRSADRGQPRIVDKDGLPFHGRVYSGSTLAIHGDLYPYGNRIRHGVALRMTTVVVHTPAHRPAAASSSIGPAQQVVVEETCPPDDDPWYRSDQGPYGHLARDLRPGYDK